MADLPEFQFGRYPGRWLGGEPRVFVIEAEEDLASAYNLQGATLLTVVYEGGGLSSVLDHIAQAAHVANHGSFQSLLESLGDLADRKPLVVVIRHADRLLADVGPALIHVLAGWERFARHGSGVHSMYLVVETGPRSTVHAAFYPGGKVEWSG
jgi:hypothetical protein